jgi:hypothetical protein
MDGLLTLMGVGLYNELIAEKASWQIVGTHHRSLAAAVTIDIGAIAVPQSVRVRKQPARFDNHGSTANRRFGGESQAANLSNLCAECCQRPQVWPWAMSNRNWDGARVKRKLDGGREGDRTPGLIVANDALSQLSYTPI